MFVRRGTPLLAVLLMIGGLVACGDDDDDAATTAVSAAPDESSDPSVTPSAPDGTDGTDGPVTSATSPTSLAGEDAEFCVPMQALATYNADTPPIDPSLPWDELQATLIGAGGDAEELYGAAVEVAPADVRDELQQLYDYSIAIFGRAEDATSLEDFQAAVGEVPAGDVLEATATVDTYIQEHCGFSLTSG